MKEIHRRGHQVSLVCRALSILSLFLFLNLSIISIHSFNNVNYTTLELNLKERERESTSRRKCFLPRLVTLPTSIYVYLENSKILKRERERIQSNKAKYQPKTFQDPLPAPSPNPLPLMKTVSFSTEWQIIGLSLWL